MIDLIKLKSVVGNATTNARKEPYVVQEFYINDFKLMIHWDDERKWFECCMHYSPHSSSYYYYDRSYGGLVKDIYDGMVSWGGKGNYKH